MNLQLKNVHFSERLSQETNAFAADVFFNGKKVGYAENDGHGGCTNVGAYPEKRDEFNEACEYAKSLPEIVYEGSGGLDGFSINSNMENQVDELFNKWLDKKEIQQNSAKGIFYEKPNGTRATTYWKGWSIKKLLETPQGRATVKNAINRLQKDGNTILNTNLGVLLS